MKLFKHQEEAVEFILARGGSGAIFHEMGLGKTRTALEVFSRLRENDSALKLLVVCPLSLVEAAWREDARKFFPGLEFVNLRRDEWHLRADVCAINYESFLSEETLKEILKMISEGPWMIVVDESSRMKSHSTLTTKTLLKVRDRFKHRIVMSGTPAPNSEMEYWAQIEFVQPGALHPSFYGFRNTWFHLENKYTGRVQQGSFMTRQQAQDAFRKGWGYRITEVNRSKLLTKIAPLCHRARKEDCLDLPEETDEVRLVELAPAQRLAYEDMKRHLVAEIRGQQIAAQVALTKIMKLRQITSSFLYSEFGEALEINEGQGFGPLTQAHTLLKEFDNPKLKELFAVIEEAGDQPIIIWINFHWEQIKVCHELEKRWPGQVVTLSALTKDKDESIRAFRDGRARFLVAHPASGGFGLNLQNCSLQIFFGLNFSYEQWIQAKGRIHRSGQKNVCLYIYLLAKNTIDEIILDVLKNKGDAQELIFETLKKTS